MSRYLAHSRSAYYGVIASLPLLILYEILLYSGTGDDGGQIRNAADVWLRLVLTSLGVSPSQASIAMILLLILAIPVVRNQQISLKLSYFGVMLVEALAYGLVVGYIINFILSLILTPFLSLFVFRSDLFWPLSTSLFTPLSTAMQEGLVRGVALSLGAGLFEELVFRVILVSLFLALTRQIFSNRMSVVLSVVGAALLFSFAHYVGSLGESLELHSFVFRWVAGVLFTVLYVVRGFAITAYSHAIYDIWVILGGF